MSPSTRAQVITRRTYNRPLGNGRFETWDETVERVIMHQRWLWERAKGKKLNNEENRELQELRQLLIDRKAMVSGRTLWLGGTDVAKTREASQFNPAHPDTKFITADGVRSFRDFNDGDKTVVLTHKGNWKPATVSYAGKQPLYKIDFVRGSSIQTEYFSENHRWLIKNQEDKVTTKELKGKSIVPAPFSFYDWSFDEAPIDEQVYWASGLIYGDGAVDIHGNARIRLCGKDKEMYLQRFIDLGCPYSYPPSCDGDAFVYFGKYNKQAPQPGTDPRLIRAFVRGYLDADGGKCTNAQHRHNTIRYASLLVANKEAQEFVRWAFPVAGIYITSESKPPMTTNFGPRNPDTIVFRFLTSEAVPYSAKEVEYVADQDVWCLTVEDDESFVLPNGIVTSNCSFLKIETVHDVVDAYWLLMQGCGVGFKPVVGTLNGFTQPLEVEVIRSTRTTRGNPANAEWVRDGVWHIMVGDSAEAWCKAAGKMLAQKHPAKKLILDFSQVRPAGERLSGYGWISSGDETINKAFLSVASLLNARAGQLLSALDILDLLNWLGTTLSSRRSAEIALLDYGHPEWADFAVAKENHWVNNPQRAQSNNSLIFNTKPKRSEFKEIFKLMEESGGSEPGFINGQAARQRAPWFSGVNPCAEILLGNKSFCNLVEIDLAKFVGNNEALASATRLIARANYRQTCVDLQDGVLQSSWHELNQFLRLTGVGLTGIVQVPPDQLHGTLNLVRRIAIGATNDMADELGLPRSKAVTTVKPSGTLSKIMDTTEGCHKPLGRYIINNVRFSKHDEMLAALKGAGYRVFDDPYSDDASLVSFPVKWDKVEFDTVDGKEVNMESAIDQLNRYKLLMNNYVDHNCSITISYSPEEVPAIIDWFDDNWNTYVGVSFLYRNDPSKTAADLGYPYLPQEVVDKNTFENYTRKLRPLNLEATTHDSEEFISDDCASGVCPVR